MDFGKFSDKLQLEIRERDNLKQFKWIFVNFLTKCS
jgi:hypothetical protein